MAALQQIVDCQPPRKSNEEEQEDQEEEFVNFGVNDWIQHNNGDSQSRQQLDKLQQH